MEVCPRNLRKLLGMGRLLLLLNAENKKSKTKTAEKTEIPNIFGMTFFAVNQDLKFEIRNVKKRKCIKPTSNKKWFDKECIS